MALHGAFDPGNISDGLSLPNGEYVRLLSLVEDASSSWPGGKLSLAFVGIAILYITYLIFHTFLFLPIYNLFISPLSKYPGPLLCHVSPIPHALRMWDGTHPKWILSLHERYQAPIVRIGPEELSFIQPEAWKAIYAHQPGLPPLQKDMRQLGDIESILSANDADHARIRKLISHAFSDKALREQEPLIQSHIDKLLAKLAETAAKDEPTNLKVWLRWTVFDIIGDLSFGRPFGCLSSGTSTDYVYNITLAMRNLCAVSIGMRFPTVAFIIKLLMTTPRARIALQRHEDFAKERVHQRINHPTPEQKDPKRKDFLSYITRYNDERGLSQNEIDKNAATLIGAGSDTTSTYLTGTMWHLLSNPEKLTRLQNDIRGAFASKEDICVQHIMDRLPYLQAVIDEGFRTYPPAAIGQPRVTPPEGRELCGEFIPGHTVVYLNQYAAFHSSQNFGRPEEFIPERWMGGEEWDWERRGVLQPFSTGPRNCIGMNLAYSEIRLLITHLLYAFDLELEPCSTHWKDDQKIFLVWNTDDLMVKMRARKDSTQA